MGIKEIEDCCHLSEEMRAFLEKAAHQFRLSARGFHRTLRVSRTIADLQQAENIEMPHIAEALQYRMKYEEE